MPTAKPPPPERGRQAASVTSSTASTRAKQATASSAITRSTSGTVDSDSKHPSKPLKAPLPKTSERISKSTSTRSVPSPIETTKEPTELLPVPEATKTDTTDTAKETPSTDLPASSTKPVPSPVPPPQKDNKAAPTPAPTSDPLQVAAQLYPWLYMTSTLDACFQSAEQTAKARKDLTARAQQLAEDESAIADERTRFQAERAVDFYDALSSDALADSAPKIIQAFLAHGEVCERTEAEALELAMHGASSAKGKGTDTGAGEDEDEDWDAPLKPYAEMLDTLEALLAEARVLEVSITNLSGTPPSEPKSLSPEGEGGGGGGDDTGAGPKDSIDVDESDTSAQAQILRVFHACLPVIRARIANLEMAQELVDSAQENVSITLRMESLGLLE